MIGKIFQKVFGSRNDRIVKQLQKRVVCINALEDEIGALPDTDLQQKTASFKQRIEAGETLDDVMNEAFAVVREAGKRALGMRHFDVQLIGGMVLHDNKITEMKTGEGKTLVATLPVYLNALSGKGVHVITVNDYLAKRDAAWMGKLYSFLGLSVGVIVAGMDHAEKQAAYAADITYGTNNEYGFDYLRDNMAFSLQEKVQRGLNFAVVDEVDSILIDEARTPLIISGPASDSSDLYTKINQLIPNLEKGDGEGDVKEGLEGSGDYTVEEKSKQIYLTEQGHEKVEDLLMQAGILDEGESLYDATNIGLMHHVYSALRANVLFQIDVDYIVKDNEIVIVDEFTGRTMPGRRWSEGLHQAVEAKEGVPIQHENQTLASITFQNYFRLYEKLSGMTGTADTEAFEFQQIYGLEVIVIPTHRAMVRDDKGDLIFLTVEEKYAAIIEDVEDCVIRKQPVLVGTTSIETSEYLSGLLQKKKVKHQILNAKQHESEAQVIAQAGSPGTVTIATNMAGRGTDIVLGGNLEVELDSLGDTASDAEKSTVQKSWEQRHEEVLNAGGLHIIGTERHESRRIDNQLRGRSGRQGDAGSTRFYLSLEDSLMRIFASERVANIMQKLGMEEGEAIEHPWVSKAIENAQRKVEAHNFDIRKNLLDYDDVANDQRRVIYQRRSELLEAEEIFQMTKQMREASIANVFTAFVPPGSIEEQWDIEQLDEALEREYGEKLSVAQWLEDDHDLHEETMLERIQEQLNDSYQAKVEQVGSEVVGRFEKAVMLQVLDTQWKDHLAAMDYLRQGIGLRGYAQKNPKQEYKRESFEMFTQMLDGVDHEVVGILARVQVQNEDDVNAVEEQNARQQQMQQGMSMEHADAASALHPDQAQGHEDESESSVQPFVRGEKKVGRNEPCWCDSGKKFKHCHGKL